MMMREFARYTVQAGGGSGSAAIRRGATATFDTAFLDALLEVAENEALEPAFRAQVLALPAESDIAREVVSVLYAHYCEPDT